MLPLYVTLQTALIAGVDHQDNQWKALFARPVPRWAVYVSKLTLAIGMVAASAILLVPAISAEGEFFRWYAPDLGFRAIPPVAEIGRQVGEMAALALLFLSIQLWVSLRWRSFSVAVGVGAIATVTSMAMLLSAGPYGGWPQYFPWSLPTLVMARQPVDIGAAMAVAGIAGIVATVAGCYDFCRREVQ
jgi:hypothetical protein